MDLNLVKVPNKVMIEIDSREKFPLLFPANIRYFDESGSPKLIRVETIVTHLPTGDYRMKEFPTGCLIERKGAARELATNLLGPDRRRCLSAIRRLCDSCHRPILLCDFSMADLQRDQPNLPAGRLVSAVARLVSEYGLTLLIAGPCKRSTYRKQLGATIVHFMLSEGVSNELRS